MYSVLVQHLLRLQLSLLGYYLHQTGQFSICQSTAQKKRGYKNLIDTKFYEKT